jgi:C-terminal processing protease CtpA/Prc
MKKGLFSAVAIIALLQAGVVAAQPQGQASPFAAADGAQSPGKRAYAAEFAVAYRNFKALGDPGQAEAFRLDWEHKFDMSGDLDTPSGTKKAIDEMYKVGGLLGCRAPASMGVSLDYNALTANDYHCLYVRAIRAYMHYHWGLGDHPNLADPDEREKWGKEWLTKFEGSDLFNSLEGTLNAIRRARDSLNQRFDYVQDPASTENDQMKRKANFGGVGLNVAMLHRDDVVMGSQNLELVAHEPTADSPARGLVHFRDVFVKLDGEDVAKMTLGQAMAKFSGQAGTSLKATVKRIDSDGQTHLVDLDLERQVIANPLTDAKPGEQANAGVWLEVRNLDQIKLSEGFEVLAHEPANDSPARGKIKEGDVIVAVDGQSVIGKTLSQAVDGLRGEPGTSVRVKVRRTVAGGQTETLYVDLTRDVIEMHSVHFTDLGNDIALIRIDQFEGLNVAQDLTTAIARAVLPLASKAIRSKKTDELSLAFADRFDALKKLLDDGAQVEDETLPIVIQARDVYDELGEGGGVILNLDDNPGGDLYQAKAVVSMLLPQGKMLAITKRKPGENQVTLEETFLLPDLEIETTGAVGSGVQQRQLRAIKRVPYLLPAKMPLVVEATELSASGSELVAGALQNNKRARVIASGGTLGKGNGQITVPLPYGVSLHATDFEFLPGGLRTNWQGVVGDIQSDLKHQRERALAEIKHQNDERAARQAVGQDSLERRHKFFDRRTEFRVEEDRKPLAEQDTERLD